MEPEAAKLIGAGLATIALACAGIGIGTIESFETDISGDTYTIQVKLFNDMTNIGTVYILENLDKEEIKTLEKSIDE